MLKDLANRCLVCGTYVGSQNFCQTCDDAEEDEAHDFCGDCGQSWGDCQCGAEDENLGEGRTP